MKNVVLTGGFGRLGQAIMRTLGADYHFIVLVRPSATATISPDLISRSTVIEVDLLDDDAGEHLVTEFSRLPFVEVLVNAAADTGFHMLSYEILSRERVAIRQLATNVVGPALCAAALFECQWKDRPLGRTPAKILNISSISGRRPFLGTRQCFYAASKAALNMLTLYMAQEYEEFSVKVNALAPGNLLESSKMKQAASAVRAIVESDISGKVFDLE